MLHSKSRSGSFDFRQKDHSSSRFSRTISIPKFCRGDPIVSSIDREALLSKKSSLLVKSPKNRINRVSNMQQHMGPLEDELRVKNDERNQSSDNNIQSHESNTAVNKNNNMEPLKNELNTDKIRELEEEIERQKLAESKMFESFVSQTKKLEETKMELEESKLEIIDLKKEMEKLQALSISQIKDLDNRHAINHFDTDTAKEAFSSLKYDLARAKEAERASALKAKSLIDEINVLRNELKSAMEAEEKSKKAMDDLALALTEVATEANHTKGKYGSTQLELEHVKGEAEQLKEMVRITEDRYEKLLEESKKEVELQKNIADRLRLEAEESLIAWNGKEKGFIDCIRITEEERARAKMENLRLAESLKVAKAETTKIRDIMKQALNEANVAKVAASIARDENSQLKDCLAEKDETMHFLARENERLMEELKRLLSKSRSTDTDTDETDTDTADTDESKLKETLSFDLEKAEALKGSIFDTVETPESEARTPEIAAVAPQRRWSSSAFSEVSRTNSSDDLEQFENPRFDDNNHRRRKSALFKRFGDMIMRKGYQRKEAANE